MKQSPSNLKYKKFHKPGSSFLSLFEQRSFLPLFGLFALKALQPGRLTFKQIEAARRTIRRTGKKEGNLWINLFTNFSLSKKPVGSRMGSGKGAHSSWVCPVRRGQILYEISGLSRDTSIKALSSAGSKLPIKTSVVKLIY